MVFDFAAWFRWAACTDSLWLLAKSEKRIAKRSELTACFLEAVWLSVLATISKKMASAAILPPSLATISAISTTTSGRAQRKELRNSNRLYNLRVTIFGMSPLHTEHALNH